MTYQQTIDYLFSQLPMFSRIGSAAFKKDLTNTLFLCKHLGNPHTRFKTIHVGGTNGKGSVSHMLSAILQTAGYKTGLYTSPHLYDFRERIRINGNTIPNEFVIQFTEKIKPVIEEIQPSFFEITVAMAFDFFAQQEVDIAVVEVGLGGRLDSTNIITPEVAVITNISLDHTNMLGHTVPEIAFEKAGLIKNAVPVVSGEKKEKSREIFQKIAEQKEAPLFFAEDFFTVKTYQWQEEALAVEVENLLTQKTYQYTLDLPGIYQTENICTVLQTTEVIKNKGFLIPDDAIKQALKSVKQLTHLQGRWEVIHHRPDIILDVAHNEAGIQQVVQQLQHQNYAQLHMIFGMVKDKDTASLLRVLPREALYYFTQAHIPRALEPARLQEKAFHYQIKGDVYNNVNEALQEAMQMALPNDLILVCGSVFLIAEVDRALITQNQ
ncbi:MAG: folylpolyglutamate synthase/dihydrofolate synthase family protein [Chitinophagaceae bacterium]